MDYGRRPRRRGGRDDGEVTMIYATARPSADRASYRMLASARTSAF
jgi:hypothetical protein